MDSFQDILTAIVHIDQHLKDLVIRYGSTIYFVLFGVIFGETGLIVLPFLPGDSLLFLAGALSADHLLNVWILNISLIIAAILGNTVNYFVGSKIGHRAFENDWRWLSRDHLIKAHQFYEKHGGKAIVMARFLPILRTFAPFIAGVSEMSFGKFQKWNILGAVLWVSIFVWGGYFFGRVEFDLFGYHISIRDNLSVIALLGFGLAFVPVIWHWS